MIEKDKKEEEKKRREKKSFKEKLFIPPRPFLPFWDSAMLIVITWSCFSSAYFAAIEFDICDEWVFWSENLWTLLFIIDILFNFVRIPEDKVNQKVTHMDLFKKYN